MNRTDRTLFEGMHVEVALSLAKGGGDALLVDGVVIGARNHPIAGGGVADVRLCRGIPGVTDTPIDIVGATVFEPRAEGLSVEFDKGDDFKVAGENVGRCVVFCK